MGRDPDGMDTARSGKRSGMLALTGLSAALVAAWMTAFELARVLEYQPHASLWFPPVAVTVAALMVLGWRGVPAIVVSSVLATLVGFYRGADTVLDAAVAQYAVIFTVQQLGVWGGLAWLLRRASRHGPPATSLPRAVTFFILGGALASLLSACIGSVGLLATGAIDLSTMIEQSIPWAIGDYAGLLALGPLAIAGVLRLADWLHVAPEPGVPRMSEMIAPVGTTARYAAKLSLLLGITLTVMLLAAALPQQPAVVFALFVVVVVQLWIVHTHGTLHTLAAIAAFSLLIAIATPLLGLGSQALALQFAMISLAANSYFGLAVPGLYADNTRLRRALVRDPVTGALSRAGFLEQVRNDLQLAAPRNRAAALIIADMDNLKAINDELGHAAGDAALRAFVGRCRRCLQPGQLIGRLGGDEFALYLPHATPKVAHTLVDKLRQALTHPREGDELPFPLSASFGIAGCTADDPDLQGLIERADAEMYADKRQRRASTGARA